MFADEWNLDVRRIDNGVMEKCIELFKQGDVEHYFDNAGRKILRTFPHAKSSKKVEYKMTYGKNGKLARVDCFIDGKLVFTEKGTYDDGGILRSLIRTDSVGKEEFATTMLVYDDKSGKLKSYGVQTKQGIIDYHYTYSAEGFLSRVRVMLNGKFISAAEYSCDDKGNPVEIRRFNEKMQSAGILKNRFKFDRYGNWTEKRSALYPTLAKRAVFAELVTRKIFYKK